MGVELREQNSNGLSPGRQARCIYLRHRCRNTASCLTLRTGYPLQLSGGRMMALCPCREAVVA